MDVQKEEIEIKEVSEEELHSKESNEAFLAEDNQEIEASLADDICNLQ